MKKLFFFFQLILLFFFHNVNDVFTQNCIPFYYWEDDSSNYHFTKSIDCMPIEWRDWWINFRGDISYEKCNVDNDSLIEIIAIETIPWRRDVDNILKIFKKTGKNFKLLDEMILQGGIEYEIFDLDEDNIFELIVKDDKDSTYWFVVKDKIWQIEDFIKEKLGYNSLKQFQIKNKLQPTRKLNKKTMQIIRCRLKEKEISNLKN